MSQPAQVVDVYKHGDMWAENYDFQHQEYRVCWHGHWRDSPDLTAFPQVPNATVTLIAHSPEVDKLWAKSQVIRYGGDSHVRLLDREPSKDGEDEGEEDEFPVCKVAVNDHQRRFIVDEFDILRELGSTDAPVVRVHPEPLIDEEGIFGFRMEKLIPIDPGSEVDKDEIIRCLDKIHEKGIVHNDFHISNVMRNKEGQVVAIDFGRSGRVGGKIAPEKRSPLWKAELYSFEADHLFLNKFFKFF